MSGAAAPDRVDLVMWLCRAHPEVFNVPPDQNDSSRLAFLPTIIDGLNAIDGGLWGALLKTDEGNKIPCDIAVWRPTMEHFDVMTGTGGSWQPRGVVVNPAWHWLDVTRSPTPDPPRPPTPAPVGDVAARLAAIEQQLDAIELDHVAVIAKLDALLARRPTPAPVYRARAFGVAIVLRPDSDGTA